jgi:hypothetical protein
MQTMNRREFFATAGLAAASPAGFRVIRGQRQLFLDDQGVARIENLRRTMQRPAKKGAVIRPTRPFETVLQTRSAPAWNPERKLFQLWMLTSTNLPGVAGTTYAESPDGLHWVKPILGQKEIGGSLRNNFVTVDAKLEWPANAMENVVYDPDDPDPARRYKGLGHCYGREPLVSPDGIVWKRLNVPKIPSSDESNLSYDRKSRTFLATVKQGGPHGRSVFLSTSKDFHLWTKPELTFHADDQDQALGKTWIERRFADRTLQQPVLNIPSAYNVDVYNMGVFRYEGVYLGMPTMFHQTGKVGGDWPGFAGWDATPEDLEAYGKHGDWAGFHHVQLALSRDLGHWRRLGDRQPFLDLSRLESGAYDLATIIGPSFPIVQGDELWFYYTGLKRYGGPSVFRGVDRDQGAICLAVLRRDGFMPLEAGAEEGVLLTQPFLLPDGELHLNVDAWKGSVRVQVCDERGGAWAGFEASDVIRSDQPDAVVRWAKRSLRELTGKPLCLRFRLSRARLFSYWLG